MFIIGIDASRANRPHLTGIERYSLENIREVIRQMPADWLVRLYVDAPVGSRLDTAVAGSNTSRVVPALLAWPPRFLWTQTRLAWEVLMRRPNILYVPGHVLPALHSRPAVAVIHDVNFCSHPSAYTIKGRLYLTVMTWLTVRTADRIIVPTQAVQKELVRFFPARGLTERIRVIPHGVSVPTPLAEGECATVRAKYGVRQPYALMLGRVERKKNVSRAIAAVEQVRRERPDLEVVLIGTPRRWHQEEMAPWKEKSWVHELGGLPDRETYALLQGASLLLFPSLAEGFGLPILEAMSYGVPVVTSTGGATEEVAAGLATLVDPLSIHDIARGVSAVLHNPHAGAAARQRHAAQFTWQKTGAATVAVLQELL